MGSLKPVISAETNTDVPALLGLPKIHDKMLCRVSTGSVHALQLAFVESTYKMTRGGAVW